MEISHHGTMASLALLMIFPLTMGLFGTMKAARAATLVVFICFLYGPENAYFKLPLFPHLTKATLPYLFMGLAALTFAANRFFRKAPGFGPEFILAFALLSAVFTARTNPEPLTYGDWMTITLPAMNLKDGFAMGLGDVLVMALPFMFGRTLFDNRDDLRMMIKAFISIMLVYTLWIFVELKMSPQMNVWLYGYFAHSEFAQTFRWGGFRPMVFTTHGLALSLIVCHACFVLAACVRGGYELFPQVKTKHLMWFMLVVLVLCKSTGSIFYALVMVPMLLNSSMKTVSRFVGVLAMMAVFYPYLRSQGLVPTETLVEWAGNLSAERAQSLGFRFENEGLLLEKAQQKLWFGWGTYGRNSIFDAEMGKESVIADGAWIIILGSRGLVGMLIELGVPAYAAITALRRLPKVPNEQDRWLLLGLLTMLSVGMLDLIPNGLYNHYPFFVAGALLGMTKGMTSPKALRAARASGNYTADLPKKKKKKRRAMGSSYEMRPPGPVWTPPPVVPPMAHQDRLFPDAPPPEQLAEDALFGERGASPPSQDDLPSAEHSADGSEAETIVPGTLRRSDLQDPNKKK